MPMTQWQIWASTAVLIVALEESSYAKNAAIIWGGNCNGSSEVSEDFLQAGMLRSMADLNAELQLSGWNSSVLYDSDHQKQITQYKPMAGSAPSRLKSATADTLIRSLEEASKDLGPNDQLLISIFTHGSADIPGNPPDRKPSRPVHGLCYKDKKGKPALLPVDDERLQAAIAALAKKGVKMAFTDSSCYGGGSIPALRKFGCVLSTQSALAPALSAYNMFHDLLKSEGTSVNVNAKFAEMAMKNTDGAVGGVMDMLTTLFRQHRTGNNRDIDINNKTGDSSGDGVITMEEAYLATLLHFQNRVEESTKKNYGDVLISPDPTFIDPQFSAGAHDFARTELFAELFHSSAHFDDPDIYYKEKGKYFSAPIYSQNSAMCGLDSAPVLETDLLTNLKIPLRFSVEGTTGSVVATKLNQSYAWDDRRTIKAEVLEPAELAKVLPSEIEVLQSQTREYKELAQRLTGLTDLAKAIESEKSIEFEFPAKDLLPEKLKRDLEAAVGPAKLARLQRKDPLLKKLFTRDSKIVFKFGFTGAYEQESGVNLNEISRKLLSLSLGKENLQLVIDSGARALTLQSDIFEAVRARVEQLPDIKPVRDKIKGLNEKLNKVDEAYTRNLRIAYAHSQQQRYYDFLAAKQATAGAQDNSGCSDFVLFTEK